MSQLSEQLNIYLERSHFTVAQLSKACSIERSTLFQYLHGKRALKNPAHLSQIMNCLYMSPSEKAELVQMFQIEQIGYDLYRRRMKMDLFIRSLPALSETPHSAFHLSPEQISQNFLFRPGAIRNKLELSQTLYALLYAAKCDTSPVQVIMQPSESSVLNILQMPVFSDAEMDITHIICIESVSRQQAVYNIDRIQAMLRFLITLKHYRPMYYYGHISEHFGPTNVLPNLFVTKHGVLEISVQENTAVLHTDASVIALFQDIFSQVEKECQPFGNVYSGLMNQTSLYEDYFERETFEDSIELCSGLCTIQFWTKDLIETYINHQLPDIHRLVDQFAEYCSGIYQKKRLGNITILLNPASVLDFLRSGIFQEYPQMFFSGPLTKEDRRIILNRVLTACREGWYHIRFIDENYFPLDCKWELCAHHTSSIIQHFYLDSFPTLVIREHGFVETLYDYFDSLLQSEHTKSEEESIHMLEKWMNTYF